jgi:hypothetical protein
MESLYRIALEIFFEASGLINIAEHLVEVVQPIHVRKLTNLFEQLRVRGGRKVLSR